MINNKFALMIRDKLKWKHLLIAVLVASLMGVIVNYFEPYPLFFILFPLLILMLLSTTIVLKNGLRKLDQFKKRYDNDEALKNALKIIFSENNNPMIIASFILMILVYFICLYQLGYFVLNLMGFFILFLGCSTFFIALISYEMYIKIIISLYKLAENEDFYHEIHTVNYFQQPFWFQYLFQLSKTLRNASLIIGILFVLENSMICIANFNKLIKNNVINKSTISCFGKLDEFIKDIIFNKSWNMKLESLPLEFWVIWIFVLLSIGLAFPIMSVFQSICIKRIVFNFQSSFSNEVMDIHSVNALAVYPYGVYLRLSIMECIENSLERTFFPQKADKFITITASLLTSLIHITSLYALFFSK